MLAFRYIFLTALVVISINAQARTDVKRTGRTLSFYPKYTVSAPVERKAGVEEQTFKNNDTTQPAGPRNGKYLILSFGSNPAEPLKLGYFTLNGSEYKYYDLEGKLLGEGTYSYETAEKQIKWQSGPFKSIGWDGDFVTEHDGKTHNIRLHNSTIGTNTLE